VARRLASRRRTRYRACPAACGAARDRILNRGGASSEGEEAQESNDSAIPPWPGLRDRNRERTPGGSKASKRACRSLTRRAQCRQDGRFEQACLRACRGGRSNDRGKTLSRLMRPRSSSGRVARAKSWRSGESDRETPGGSASAVIGNELARKQVARESGYGSSGRESSEGTFQGRERHETRPRSTGRHGTRGVRKDPERAASIKSLNRREGQEP